MKKRSALLLSVPILSLLLPGCLFVAGAAGGALGIHATGDDSYKGTSRSSFDKVFDVSEEVLSEEGTVKTTNDTEGIIKGEAYGSWVKIRIRGTSKRTNIKVSARENIGGVSPDKDTARILIKKIEDRLGQ